MELLFVDRLRGLAPTQQYLRLLHEILIDTWRRKLSRPLPRMQNDIGNSMR